MLVHKTTQKLFDYAVQSSNHGVLFSGEEGSGKFKLASMLVRQKLLLQPLCDINAQPYVLIIEPIENTISIDQIRELNHFFQLKVPGKNRFRRAVIIGSAHKMTTEAQNSLLKALEEPPEDTIILLTAPNTLQIKETIYSRVQQITVYPVSEAEAINFYSSSSSSADIKKAYTLSGGRAELLDSILSDKDHPLLLSVDEAKQILSASVFDRLLLVDSLAKDKQNIAQIVSALKLICLTATKQQKDNQTLLAQWLKRSEAVYQTEKTIQQNANSKILLTNLMLQL